MGVASVVSVPLTFRYPGHWHADNNLEGFPASRWQALVARPALRELHLARTKLGILCVAALLGATVEIRSRVTVVDVEGAWWAAVAARAWLWYAPGVRGVRVRSSSV